jgi:hypothetical protein
LKGKANQRALTRPEIDPSRFGNASRSTTAMRHGFIAAVRPGMIGAALDEHVASAKRYELLGIEEHIDSTRDTDRVVHGVGALGESHCLAGTPSW